jgi:hypothetical protein
MLLFHIVVGVCLSASLASQAPSGTVTATVTGKTVMSTTNTKSNGVNMFQHVYNSLDRLTTGVLGLVPSGMEVLRLKDKLQKDASLVSYSELKKIERFSDDMGKMFRLAVTIPLSPELFFYSYIVGPMLSPSNPFAWTSLPSGFDNKVDFEKRKSICTQRRFNGLIHAFQLARRDLIEDFSEEGRARKLESLKMVIKAVSAPSHNKALEILSPWLYTEKATKRPVSSLRILGLNGAVIKDCCRSIGIDGMPNVPLIRRFNIGELNRYCQRVRLPCTSVTSMCIH